MTITQKNGGLHIQLTVTNTGHRDGDEVVQIYARHVDSKVSRPLEQLVAFQRVHVLKGQSRQITAEVPLMRLAYWDEAAKSFVVEHDHVEIRAGASSDDIRLRQTVTIDAGDSNEKKVGMAHAGNE
jgi:beta-glucosidase